MYLDLPRWGSMRVMAAAPQSPRRVNRAQEKRITSTPCRVCGAEIPYKGAGRPRTMCDECFPTHRSQAPGQSARFPKGSSSPLAVAEEDVAPVIALPERPPARATGGRGLELVLPWPGDVIPDGLKRSAGWPGTVVGRPWTTDHFRRWCDENMVFEDGERHPPEDWQIEVVTDLMRGFQEVWLLVPEGNSKSTLIAELGLYHLDNTLTPWIPVGASSRDQAEILFGQAQGFVERSFCAHGLPNKECCDVPGLKWDRNQNPRGPFHLAGHRQIKHSHHGGRGMKVYAADEGTADGVIPTLSLLDEGHRAKNLNLYRTWNGKWRKRRGQIVMISTAGEPGSDFEKTRDSMRQTATERSRKGESYLRAATETTVLHEYAVPKTHLAKNLELVKAANPLSIIELNDLRQKLASPTLDYGEDWLRKTCNIPARSSMAAVSDIDWDRAYTEERIPENVPILVGADFAWTHDTTALVPMWTKDQNCRIVDRVEILVPPRDGSMLDHWSVRSAFLKIHARNPIMAIVADKSKAQDTLLWVEEEFGCIVVDRPQTPKLQVEDYENFMEALRGGASPDEVARDPWFRHNGDLVLREHVMNAIAALRPGDKRVFDRPSSSRANAEKQDRRVIDALTASAMVNTAVATGWDLRPQPMVAVVSR